MRSLNAAAVILSAFISTTGAAQTSPAGPEDSIRVISQSERASNPGAATLFTGHAQVEQLFAARDSSRLTGGIVTFQPGARSAWHTHPLGQILIVTAGSGLVQQWGFPARAMRVGDVVWIPAGVKHWHGASPSSGVTHIAIQEIVDGKNVDWMESVTDQQYPTAKTAP